MFDTLGMKYYTDESIKWQNLEFAKEVNEIKTGYSRMRAKLKNLNIIQIPEGILINGSISKYYLGNNLESLTRKGTKQAIEKISDELNLKLENSEMFKIDVSQNFIMQDKVKNYLNCLDELKGFKKSTNEKSIYFRTNRIELIIYDKIAEMRKKRAFIPEDFKQFAGHILRYEMRYKRNLKRVFKKVIHFKDLTDENFYNFLIDKWKSLYFKINKKNKLKFNNMALKDVKQFQNQIMLIGLNSLGLDEVNNMIELSRNELDRYKIKRIKDKIKQIKGLKELTEVNPLIKELDSKVNKKNVYC